MHGQIKDYLVGLSNYDVLIIQKDNMIELTLSLAPPLLLLVTSGLETKIQILIIWSKNYILVFFSSKTWYIWQKNDFFINNYNMMMIIKIQILHKEKRDTLL